jgi:hypothetical protein
LKCVEKAFVKGDNNMFYGHPMSANNQLGYADYKQLGEYHQMGMLPYTSTEWDDSYGGWFDDIVSSVEQSVLQPLKSSAESFAKDLGLSDKDINKISSELDAEYKKKIEDEKKKAAQDLARSVIGITEGSKTATTAAPTTSIVDTVAKQFQDLQQSDVVKAVPGGLYTILGVGAAGLLFLLLRK